MEERARTDDAPGSCTPFWSLRGSRRSYVDQRAERVNDR
jgi:hypothetical protein